MRRQFPRMLALALLLFSNLNELAPADESARPLILWYDRPAAEWTEALPVGNGRLGGMIFGGTTSKGQSQAFDVNERIQYNEDTFWTGQPYDPNVKDAWKHLENVQRLVFDGDYLAAHKLAQDELMGNPSTQMAYQPVGDVLLRFPSLAGKSITDYRRQLDLNTAVAISRYTIDGTTYTREVFSSARDQVLVVRISADRAAKVDLTVDLDSPHKTKKMAHEGPNGLTMLVNGPARGRIAGGLQCFSKLSVKTYGGFVKRSTTGLEVSSANSATIVLAAATNFVNYKDISGDPDKKVNANIQQASAHDFDTLLARHLKYYRNQFHRVHLDLGKTAAAKAPTDLRIKNFAEADDPQLAELYFQYGRYLLISSSQPGSQPANLQGLWNDQLSPPWQSKYTININFEMNYWPSETTNLSECHAPLFTMLEDLAESGERTAKAFYNAKGWVCHHNSDIWLASAPLDGPAWGMWPSGGAWLCQHIWYRYEFTHDGQFLRRYYPIMKSSADFFLDVLVTDPNTGFLVTCPSISPEMRRLRHESEPEGISICAGPTMDMQIVRDLLSHCIQASEILETDESVRSTWKEVLDKLAPMQIGEAGQLQEWQDDYDLLAPQRTHRHVSHLYGLFPSDQITSWQTPKLFQAARKSLELRGDGGTGWSKAWKINFWAHLHDGDRAYRLLESLITSGTYPNMFDSHPPFQIDGNFGGANGVAEMLVQSYSEYADQKLSGLIHILPALPSRWPNGKVTGLRTRGGFEVSLEWSEGELKQLDITNLDGAACVVLYRGVRRNLDIAKGKTKTVLSDDFTRE